MLQAGYLWIHKERLMRRILFIGLLLVCAISYGQRFAFPNSAHLGAGEENYGSNMITNGTFADASDWTINSAYEISGGTLTYDNSLSNSTAYQVSSDMVSALESDSHYKLTFTIVGTGSIAFKNYPPGTTLISQDTYTDDTYEIEFETGTLSYYGFEIISIISTGSYSIDNIILQKRQ